MNRVTDQGVWIESELPLADTPQWSIPLRLVSAVAEGKTANLGSVSPLLAGNLETIRDIYAAWIPGHKVPLNFELSRDAAAPSHGVSLFFSGGVDSFYSLIKHREEVKNLVLIHGFDVPLAETKSFALAEAQAREVVGIFGKRLIVVRTNLHWEESSLYTDRPCIPCGWKIYGGAVLAAVAYALTPIHGKTYIASSFSYADLHPDGTHPLLDPLWSTEALQIVHDGGETRMEKLRVLVQHPEALSRLRVCWENLGNYNCGLCEKCIRTMLGLRALGVEHCAAFPDTLTPELVREQELNHAAVFFWREILDAGLPPALNAAVKSAIHSYDHRLPPRTGKPKREVKRWLYAARNAGRALIAPFDRY
jgi:7-cyano-7-deazaguanine synthase in queuosine biosynthesis